MENDATVLSQNTDFKIGYKDILTQKEYLKLIIANIISRFGDSIDSIAFTWLVYAITGSAAWSAIIFALNQLPTIIIQPFAGALVEQMHKKKLMLLTDLIRGLIVLLLAYLYILNAVTPGILVIFTLAISTVEAFRNPAGTAFLPRILQKDYYSFGMSLNSSLCTVSQLIGLAIAGAVIGVYGIGFAIFIDGVTFFASALIILFIRSGKETLTKQHLTFAAYGNILKDGFLYIKNKPVIRNFCIMAVLINALLVPLNAFQTPLVVEVLGQSSALLSLMSIALMGGMGLGALLFPYLAKVTTVRKRTTFIGFVFGIAYVLLVSGVLFKAHPLMIYLITMLMCALIGGAVSILSSTVNVEFMKHVEDDYLARAGAIMGALSCAAMPVVSFILSIFASLISIVQIFILCGTLCAIVFLVIEFKKVRLE